MSHSERQVVQTKRLLYPKVAQTFDNVPHNCGPEAFQRYVSKYVYIYIYIPVYIYSTYVFRLHM